MMHFKLFAISLLFASLAISTPAFSQSSEKEPIREVGIGSRNLSDNFTLIYKKEVESNKYRRYDASVSFGYRKGIDIYSKEFATTSLSFTIGTEKRNYLRDKFKFVHGIFYGCETSLRFINTNNEGQITPFIGYQLGVQYDINDQFYIGATTFPSLRSEFNFDQNNNWIFEVKAMFSPIAEISILYRLR